MMTSLARSTGSRATATFHYLAPIHRLNPPELPFRARYAYAPPKGRPLHNELLEPHSFEVHDLRRHGDVRGLDKSGFDYVRNVPTGFKEWESDEEIVSSYYPETVRLIKDALGASRVFIFDHTIRRRVPDKDNVEDRAGRRQPVFRDHQRLETSPGPVLDSPLGLCDIRSVEWEKDLVVGKLLYRDRTGYTYLVHYNPAHKWYYLPEMQADECYDNKLPRAIAPHSGFVLDNAPVGVEPRQSIEIRCLVFYEDQPV
ncbi:hypothetical protein EHS25_010186 [Saitozyma podzolica]|uniref:Uncharacterized protein n=1 Tax=Saitozyma podzolica TaxID=1890683 RepID=A0A427YIW3_9TREE|nr:hypothetical protein EHS25_010186 [Saitozyma podzolica]